jgi:DMSO/TMAO reductase YedYZ molybdopterin-dependent catalytic subunit
MTAAQPAPASADAEPHQRDPKIAKPLPPEWFVEHDTNAEMRWESAREQRLATANRRFFVRNHTRTPHIDPETYRLRVFGDGLRGSPTSDDPLMLSLDDIRSLPRYTLNAFLECTGNGRALFAIQQQMAVPGTPWLLGGIGMATWSGVRLSTVLRWARMRPEAINLMATGLDEPYLYRGVDYGRVRRPLPISKALDDCMLVLEMNGEPLPPDHGFPLRLLVPGWVGIASIKWLGQLEVSARRLESPWNTIWYRMTGGDYPADSPPLTEVPVRSTFELPWGAVFKAGEPVMVGGRSWSGAAAIERVEVSLDGGSTWQTPEITGPNRRYSWAHWEIPWVPSVVGTHQLLARATDKLGRTQPDTVPFNNEGYLFWAVVRHPVSVV